MAGDLLMLNLGASVADGSDIDWVRYRDAAADDDERQLVDELHLVAEIAALHRTPFGRVAPVFQERGRVVGRIGPAPGPSIPPAPGATEPPRRGIDWGHFALGELLGSGSFGDVYRATDTRLDRQVAIKLVKPGLPGRAGVDARVLSEGRLLAQVRHPNVVTVFAAEVHDGQVGLCMELVQGAPLDELVERQGAFSACEAALIGEDLCRALAAVHTAGLVHRDVKARNVMREQGGRVVLMDFGAGQLRREAPAPESAWRLTGTPLYLAPEVLDGQEATVRSDLYSLGVLLFHLVTAQYPVAATSLDELRQAHRSGHRQRLHDLRPTLSERFVRVVERALAPDPAQRFESAGEMLSALADTMENTPAAHQPAVRPVGRGILAGLVVAAALIVAGLLWWRPTFGGVAPPTAAWRSITIVPFRDRAPTAEHGYVGVGLADVLTAKLANTRVLQVRSLRRAERGEDDPAEVGAALGVDLVLSGSYLVHGSDLTLAYTLLDVPRGTQLAGNVIDIPVSELGRLEHELAARIAESIEGLLTAQDRAQLLAPPTPQSAAFQELLRSSYELDRFWREPSGAQLESAERHLLLSLEQDPRFALALVALARLRWISAFYGYGDARQALAGAEDSATRALAQDGRFPDAHAALGLVSFQRGELDAAREHIRQALQVGPGTGLAYYAAGFYYMGRGLSDQSVEAFSRAQRLDPDLVQRELGFALQYQGDWDSAIEQYQADLKRHPGDATTMKSLVFVLLARGRVDDAMPLLEGLHATIAENPGVRLLDALAAVRGGRPFDVDAWIASDRRFHWFDGGFSGNVAAVLAQAGRTDEAATWLQRAAELQMRNFLYVSRNPFYDPLKGHAGFDTLLSSLGAEWDRARALEERDPLVPPQP